MRDLKIEDLKAGVKLRRKDCGSVIQIDAVDIDGNMIIYMDGQWDFITGDWGILDDYYLLEEPKDEVEDLISSRSNGTYNQISDDASAIITTLGTDEYAYFFSQIANKLARIKHGYSVEDSLLDIAGYAKLELDKFRGGEDE